MSEKIVQLNEDVIKGQLKELVRGSVEEALIDTKSQIKSEKQTEVWLMVRGDAGRMKYVFTEEEIAEMQETRRKSRDNYVFLLSEIIQNTFLIRP